LVRWKAFGGVFTKSKRKLLGYDELDFPIKRKFYYSNKR
jgi:hypothetical protein